MCALVIATISILPLINAINLCCGGMIIGGFLSVNYFYKKSNLQNIDVNVKDVSMIALLGGILSAVLVSGIMLLTMLFSGENQIEIMKIEIMKTELSKYLNNIFPDLQSTLDNLSGEFNKYGFSPTLSINLLLINLIIYPVFAFVGGLISYGINIRKKNFNP
jgi:hypothetical protein